MSKIHLSDFRPTLCAAAGGDQQKGFLDETAPENGRRFLNEMLAPAFIKAQEASEPLEVSLNGVSIIDVSFLSEAFGGLAKKMRAERGIEVTPENLVITGSGDFHRIFIRGAWFEIKLELARRVFAGEPSHSELIDMAVEIEVDARKQLRRSSFLPKLWKKFLALFDNKPDFISNFVKEREIYDNDDRLPVYRKMMEIVARNAGTV